VFRLNIPFFSIVIPVFNSQQKLSNAVESFLSQTFGDFEILLIDGLSSDNTMQLILQYAAKDGRIRFISEKDSGVYDAMNKGIDISKGTWLYFIGSDDTIYDNSTLQQVHNACIKSEADVLYGNVFIDGDTSWAKHGTVYDGSFDFGKLISKNICHQSIFYKAQFIKQEGLKYNNNYRLLADWDFNLKCFANTRFEYLNLIIANFFAGGLSTRSNLDKNFSADFAKNIQTYFKLSAFDKRIFNSHSPIYYEMLQQQKTENIAKYYYYRLKAKLNL